ncbi:iron-containing alcohol dehydrogenase [Clostridium sp. MSJ-8]|uniref:iron-containing alcohol dehydrogenase n=1 Tax=Clostridium sp. MSJ-8 TaxID=2841510 RepID=UPI001C0EE387|nr:iron-containing alcohol dehydrogenase [Clostridium sp. MSJ-8]MBU5486947.1 iron-containing alcohol dehydrogenase [Clostridium sp. MSJ-8]
MEFNYYLPVNLIFGRGKVDVLGKETKKYGKKAMIVTGRNSTKKTGLLDKAKKLLKEAGIYTVVFDKVAQNPLTTTVYEGANIAKEKEIDVIVGLGGGSIMDAAKSIAFMSKNDGDVSDYIYNKKHSDEALPIILVPTTCGTGSEGNSFSVLTNPDNNDKKSLRCNAIVAKASIIDPELMTTMPKHILASVGFDALCHNMEAYISRAAQPLTDMKALQGIELIGKYLVRAYNDPTDIEAYEKITWASTLGGMVINNAGVAAPHGMEHPASGLKDIVHGRGLAALTPVIYEESIDAAPEKFAVISKLLGGTDEKDCVETIKKLLKDIDLETTLGEQGITEEDVDWMAENCMKVSAPSMAAHPKEFSIEDIKRIYKKAL